MGKGGGKGGASSAKQEAKPGFFEGFAGTTKGSFFEAPLWVDQSKPAGHSSQEPVIAPNPNWTSLVTGQFLFWSPNLVWLLVALADYAVFPYDLEAAKSGFALSWIVPRMWVNIGIVFGYFGFWHVTLYWLHWGKRPFKPDRLWSWNKVTHNMFYCLLGAMQWTVWEAIFMYSYATGRLPYLSDAEAFGTPFGLLNFVAWFFIVPLFRELHFYFAHRFIHIKFLYKYVHSLHHRNTDIEPFSGLCMHPIEHLYYYSCIGPSLYVFASPFAFMWNGVHLLISPAASHSGFEDNFQSDQFHYLHHRYFECNYGTGTFPFDYWFGTFRESLGNKSSTYKGEHDEGKDKAIKLDKKTASNQDKKATLLGLPSWDEGTYNALSCAVIPAVVYQATTNGTDHPHAMAFLLSCGPPLLGAALCLVTSRTTYTKGLRYTLLYPFHKEALLGAFGFNCLAGFVLSVLPVYHMIHMLLAPPGESVYFQIYGGGSQ